MPAHAAYMRDIRLSEKKSTSSTHTGNQKDEDDGARGTANVKTQTNDDAENVQSQTDEIDVRVMWTQHPSEGEHTACGSGSGSDANQFSGALLRKKNGSWCEGEAFRVIQMRRRRAKMKNCYESFGWKQILDGIKHSSSMLAK